MACVHLSEECEAQERTKGDSKGQTQDGTEIEEAQAEREGAGPSSPNASKTHDCQSCSPESDSYITMKTINAEAVDSQSTGSG